MASYSFQDLFRGAFLNNRLNLRARIKSLKIWFNHLPVVACIKNLGLIFGKTKCLRYDGFQIDRYIRQSDIFHDQARKIQLAYSITTFLKPVNFDLSIFFVTSPPVLIRV